MGGGFSPLFLPAVIVAIATAHQHSFLKMLISVAHSNMAHELSKGTLGLQFVIYYIFACYSQFVAQRSELCRRLE